VPLISTLAAIAGLVSAGVGTGLEVDSALNKPSTTVPTASTQPTVAQQTQTNLQEKAAVGQQLPQLEGLTSGFANPGYYAQQGAAAAGTAGSPGGSNTALQAVEQAFGLPPGSLGPGSGGASSAPSKYTTAGSGTGTGGTYPASPVDLSDFVNNAIST
jgi:hypothetical protein